MNMRGNTPGTHTGQEKNTPKNTWRTLKRLLGYMEKSKLYIALTILITIAGTVMQVLSPKLLGRATTTIFEGITTGLGVNFSVLPNILLWCGVLYLGYFLSTVIQQRLMVVLAEKTTYGLRKELKGKMNKTPLSYFDKQSNGVLMSIATNDVDNVATNLQESVTALISSIILIIGVLFMMLSISPLLTLIALAMIPGSLLVMKVFSGATQTHSNKYLKEQGALNGHIEETYQGFTVIKGFHAESEALSAFEETNQKMYKAGWKARFFGGSMMPTAIMVENIVYVFLTVVGAIQIIGGKLSIGDMQAFLQYSSQFSSPISRLTQIWGNTLSALASAERIFDILDSEELKEYDKIFTGKQTGAKVSFDDVTFSYDETPLLQNFDMEVQKDQLVAIVGHTGAGKTTLLNLLERFYEIQDGAIRIDGIDIRNLPYEELRSKMGMVLQDTWLFSGTIYENIQYGNLDATHEQVIAAAKAAYADEFIRKLPDGYDTALSEDAQNLSQGQKQLLSIARAFVANPEILILDEATSNVDSRTEMIIQKAIKKLMNGRTSFVVAHRLSTIYEADVIVVMENGNIVESGTHKELLEENGVYADIYYSQFSYQAELKEAII